MVPMKYLTINITSIAAKNLTPFVNKLMDTML